MVTPQGIKNIPAFRVATLAVMIAVTAVFTYMVRIPIAPTRGYINFGDVAVFFSAILFGPFTAFITGGIGTALADLISGYAQWAPFTFFAHGLQGFAAGMIMRSFIQMQRKSAAESVEEGAPPPVKPRTFILPLSVAFLGGTLVMMGIYFLSGGILVGFPAAATELPGNLLQNVAGVMVGGPLAFAVLKAYPPLKAYIW